MSLENDRAQSGEPLRDRRTSKVGPGNPVAKIQQHLGNPAHADAADAYEMYALNLGEHENSNSETAMIGTLPSQRRVRTLQNHDCHHHIVIVSEAKDLLSSRCTRQQVLRFAQDDELNCSISTVKFGNR